MPKNPVDTWGLTTVIPQPDIPEPADLDEEERALLPTPPPETASEETLAAYAWKVQSVRNDILDTRLNPRKPRNKPGYDPYLDPDYDWLTPHPGPTAGYTAGSLGPQQEVDDVIRGEPVILWVEGRVRIGNDPWDLEDTGTRAIADRFEADGKRLGFRIYRAPDPGDDPGAATVRRRWT